MRRNASRKSSSYIIKKIRQNANAVEHKEQQHASSRSGWQNENKNVYSIGSVVTSLIMMKIFHGSGSMVPVPSFPYSSHYGVFIVPKIMGRRYSS